MEKRNGYFQIVSSENGVSVKLFPEVGEGKKIDINDIKEYLRIHRIVNCDLLELTRIIDNLQKEETVYISSEKIQPIDEFVKVKISEDSMIAKVRFYPPSNGGKKLSSDIFKSKLNEAGVEYGIDDRVFKYHSQTPMYCTSFIIAKGKPVKEGTDASIEYLFNIDRHAKPKRNDDGSVNFHELNNISHIREGDVLAILHPEYVGENGINVRGVIIKPHPVAHKTLKFGKNIELSEDKQKLTSKVDGHAVLEGDRVFVSNTYDVPADVDNSTGDIDYGGNVLIHGNVKTGFKVKASGDIEVLGSVEGAELIAGGNVILHHGMQGMAKGKIVARGNIVAKFMESVRVFAEGYIEVEAIIQSQVSATGDINVNGKKGHIIGGYIRSASNINAKVIGSAMGISTIVEVGFEPNSQDKINNLKNEIKEKNKKLVKCAQLTEVLNQRLKSGNITLEQKATLQANMKTVEILKEELLHAQEELDKSLAGVMDNKDSSIKVYGNIYPGAQLRISGENYNIHEELSYCKFYKSDGEVKKGAI